MKDFLMRTLMPLLSINVEPINQTIYNLGDTLAGFAQPICFVVFVVSGLAMMSGQQGRQWAKPSMLFGAVGFVVVMFARTIVNALQNSIV